MRPTRQWLPVLMTLALGACEHDYDLAILDCPPRADGVDARQCPTCTSGQLSLKLGKYGAFIGCVDSHAR